MSYPTGDLNSFVDALRGFFGLDPLYTALDNRYRRDRSFEQRQQIGFELLDDLKVRGSSVAAARLGDQESTWLPYQSQFGVDWGERQRRRGK